MPISLKGSVVKKRLLLNLGKYVLAAGLLFWVVWSNWAPPPNKAVATLAASSVALCSAPGEYGPLVAASAAAVPERIEPRGLGYVWKHHVVQRQPIHVGFLITAFLLYAGAVLLTLFRWYLLVRALDLPLRVRDAMRFGLIGLFFNAFLPGAVGGDLIKGAVLARGQSRRTAAFATVIMDRGIALWALVWFVAVLGSLFWLGGLFDGPSAGTAAVIVAVAVAIVVVSAVGWMLLGLLPDWRAERFAGRLKKLPLAGHSAAEFWRAVWIYRKRPNCVAIVMLLTCIGQAGFVLAFYCGASAFWSTQQGLMPTLMQHFLVVPMGLVMQALVPTPGGAGAGEWAFGALYVLFAAPEANGVLASLVRRLMDWSLGLAGYAVYLWTRSEVAAKPAVEDQTPVVPSLALPEPAQSALAG
jgi:uncharacterized membrane protein YbhN (UPF0104 family)